MRGLITGILGQSGMFMAELLHSKGYLVYGIIKKNSDRAKIEELKRLVPGVIIYSIDITKKEEIKAVIDRVHPHEMYNFAGVSDVIDPNHNIGRTMDINATAPRHMLECIDELYTGTKFFQASSRLIFGKNHGHLNESSMRVPEIPYAAAKLEADHHVRNARENGIFACSGIFFNHESERRPERFFSRKVSIGVAKMFLGLSSRISIGNLEAIRDFGYAKDYALAAWMMLQSPKPTDYVIGTGETISTGDYLNLAISMYNIQSCCSVFNDSTLYRAEENFQRADISKIKSELEWEPTTSVPEIIKKMVDYDISLLQKQTA